MKPKRNRGNRYFNREIIFYILMIILVVGFWLYAYYYGASGIKDIISTSTGLIAAVMVWLQLKRTEKLNEAAYIKDFNNQFIVNKDMTLIEHALELYYNQVCEGIENPVLALDLSRESEDCQKLINYLVYLESMAAVVQQRVMHIESIHNLFAYRFFIAVNNPVIQMFEIYPYAEYYQGIFFLSEYWTQKCKKKNGRLSMDIPLEEFALSREKCTNFGTNIRKAKISDSYGIAKVLYQTDPYIYPSAFGKDPESAARAMKHLIEMEEGMFSYHNVIVAVEDGRVIGTALCLKENKISDVQIYLSSMKGDIENENDFKYAFEHYFSKQGNEDGKVCLMAFAVDAEHRDKNVGRALLSFVCSCFIKETIELEVLDTETGAKPFYYKYGFTVKKVCKDEGFAPKGEDKPDVLRMVRPSLVNTNK